MEKDKKGTIEVKSTVVKCEAFTLQELKDGKVSFTDKNYKVEGQLTLNKIKDELPKSLTTVSNSKPVAVLECEPMEGSGGILGWLKS